jgi:hypothetical protein
MKSACSTSVQLRNRSGAVEVLDCPRPSERFTVITTNEHFSMFGSRGTAHRRCTVEWPGKKVIQLCIDGLLREGDRIWWCLVYHTPIFIGNAVLMPQNEFCFHCLYMSLVCWCIGIGNEALIQLNGMFNKLPNERRVLICLFQALSVEKKKRHLFSRKLLFTKSKERSKSENALTAEVSKGKHSTTMCMHSGMLVCSLT